jgi:hypothetical protein
MYFGFGVVNDFFEHPHVAWVLRSKHPKVKVNGFTKDLFR